MTIVIKQLQFFPRERAAGRQGAAAHWHVRRHRKPGHPPGLGRAGQVDQLAISGRAPAQQLDVVPLRRFTTDQHPTQVG